MFGIDDLALAGIGSALIGGVSSLITGNKNVSLQRETNEQSYQMFKEQQQFSKDMYSQQLKDMQENYEKYQSPAAVVASLRQAGINPALAMGSASAGSLQAGSVPSSPAAPSLRAPEYRYSDTAFNVASQILGNIASSSKDSSEARGFNINNQFQVEKNKSDIALVRATISKLMADKAVSQETKKKLRSEIVGLDAYNDYFNAVRDGNILQVGLSNEVLRQQAKYLAEQALSEESNRASQTVLTQLAINKDSREAVALPAVINELYQRAFSESESGRMTREERYNFSATIMQRLRKLNADALKSEYEAQGVRLSNQQAERMLPLVVRSMENEVRQQGSDYWNPFRYVGSLLGGAGAAAVKIAK